MQNKTVLDLLNEGKKMRHLSWERDKYVFLSDDDILVNQDGQEVDVSMNLLFSGSWEEHKEEFKKGDWVYIPDFDEVKKIRKVNYSHLLFDDGESLDLNQGFDDVRKATTVEIKYEIKRRKWASWGRSVYELKLGDIVRHYGEVIEISDEEQLEELQDLYQELIEGETKIIPTADEDIHMVCLVDDRQDKRFLKFNSNQDRNNTDDERDDYLSDLPFHE